MCKVLPATLLALALGLPVLAPAADTTKRLEPINLPINTPADEDEPHVGDSSRTLYWLSLTRKDQILFHAQRRQVKDLWPKKGEEIDDYVKNKGDIRGVYATQGRYPHYLYFAARDREGKNYDLFAAMKLDERKVWSAPTPLMSVNTPADEVHPWLTSDGKALYFSRKTKDGFRVCVSTRTSVSGPGGWREAVELDLPADFHHATLSPDGKTMYLQGPLANNRWGLFTSTRTAKGWSKPEPIEALNDPQGKTGDCSPNLSRDGRLLYFSSDRPGGKGGKDIWVIQTAQLKKK
jgi:hypothetical protein